MLVKKLESKDFQIEGYPRLVRLNPNIPWKTRGNGAISLKIKNGNSEEVKQVLEETIEKYAMMNDKKTNPGYVILEEPPSLKVYEKTIRDIVSIEETKHLLDELGAEYKGYKNSRGLIGATASIAWSSKRDKTYELITYREKKKWGTKRTVDDKSTKEVDKKFGSTFDNYDYQNKHNRLVPSSPCPVLYGIRGNDKNELIKTKSIIKSETISDWIVFETNQGTDDHLQRKRIKDIQPYRSVIVNGIVCKNPHTIKGGHVIFSIKDSTGKIDSAAYEPTKQFRDIIRQLHIGDKVEVYGGVREKPLTVNLEKINVIHLEKQIEKVENPICPKCGKHMKSKGKDQGFKCKICGLKSEKPILKETKRQIHTGFYEVPVCARRHLSKPLKRMN